ncbi:translation initiation factor IF3-2, chloroplastic-like [Phoenix dactylifera]|uniref:Translation initiation factor IF3-2, chloroplastic-like n=1 Tax=Phoenix dactylifera TaxID=42345 RepID=A0A8B9ADH5_PHODC|nr:translation initiation factor IF3-2, chloroplastic-like [Phoenix dactylifera]XP_038981998.1 translation initiation factor IF3-2, chloroplastic-like [Phoenix dactylifera]
MAGIAAFQFKPFTTLSRAPTASNPIKPVFHAFFLVRLPKKRVRGCRPPFVTEVGVVARYGSGFRPGPSSGDSRRFRRDNRVADPDYDPALDLDRVKSSSVRLLDEQQNMIGVMSKSEAMQMADDADLVLAILSADADPPVLRLFESADYKKHKYEQQKKKKVQQKRSAASRVDIKELKMGYNIDSHDYSVRLKAAQKFLKDGDKVKVIVNLRGRQNEFRNIAIELIKRFQSDLGEMATEESKSFSERNIFMVLMPNKAVLQKAQEQPKKKETPVTEVSASA